MKLIENHSQKIFVRGYLVQMIAVHVFTILGVIYLWTGAAFGFAFTFAALFAYSMGIFHHMYFTHDSFKCKPWIAKMGALFGTLTWRGPMAPPIRYGAIHKVHHAYADRDDDPHTPEHGIFHAYMAWWWRLPYGLKELPQYEDYLPNHSQNTFYRWLDKNVNLIQFIWGALCFVYGYFLEGQSLEGGLRYLVFGVFVKSFIVIYLANTVDVVNHTVGYRNYDSDDKSTNSFIMAVVHLGGAISWHNNHHAHEEYFTVRTKWWELDAHYIFLRILSLGNLVWDIGIKDDYTTNKRAAKQAALKAAQ